MGHLRRTRREDRIAVRQDIPGDFLGRVRYKISNLRSPNAQLERLVIMLRFLTDLETSFNEHSPEAEAIASDVEEAFERCTRVDVFVRAMTIHPELFAMDRTFLAEDAYKRLQDWEKLKVLKMRLKAHLETLDPG